MPQSLQSLPVEVVEHIVELLDLVDICNLRLSCATLATKASPYRFSKFFESLHVDLTADSLLSFSNATQKDSPLCKVRTLHLTGIIRELNDSAIPSWARKFIYDAPSEHQIQLLTHAFNGLAKRIKDSTLPSLSLRVAVLSRNNNRDLPRVTGRGYPLKSLWQCTTTTFYTAIRALAASKLRITRLDVFNDWEMQNCSLSCDQLNLFDWTDYSILNSLTALSTLSISLTDRIFVFNEDEEIDEDFSDDASDDGANQQATQRDTEIMTACREDSNVSGLANLIAACPHLEDFELHYLSSMWPKRHLFNNFPRQDILRYVARLDKPPVLRKCRIRGATARDMDFLDLIRRSRIADASFERVNGCNKLHIDTVFEKSEEGYTGLVHFVKEGISAKYGGEFEVGTEILNRGGDNRTKPVNYYARRPISEGNPTIYEWNRVRRGEYGY